MQDLDVIREFLVESHENLSRLDQELVELEKRPKDAALLASIFRTIHTIKGTCGFLGFQRLGALAHISESILSELRDGASLQTALQVFEMGKRPGPIQKWFHDWTVFGWFWMP